jgi:hypothetical protein
MNDIGIKFHKTHHKARKISESLIKITQIIVSIKTLVIRCLNFNLKFKCIKSQSFKIRWIFENTVNIISERLSGFQRKRYIMMIEENKYGGVLIKALKD